MSVSRGRVVAAILVAALVTLSPLVGAVSGVTESSEGTRTGETLTPPSVDAPNVTIDDTTTSNITVSYNLSGAVSNGDLDLLLTSPKGLVGINHSLPASGNATFTIPADEFGGGEFQYVVYGWNNSSGGPISGSFESAWLNVTSNASVTSYDVNRTTVAKGENVTVNATVTNPGSTAENVTVGPYWEMASGQTNYLGENLGRMVEVPAGETTNVSFEGAIPQSGTFDLWVNNQSATTVTVEEAATPLSDANTTVADLNVTTDAVSVSETGTVNVTLQNPASVDETVDFWVNAYNQRSGSLFETHTAAVNASETKTVSVPVDYTEFGDWTTSVGGISDTVDVLASGTNIVFEPGYVSDNETVVAGKPQSFFSQVANYGDTAGTSIMNLTYGNGTLIDNQTVTLDSGNTSSVYFETAFNQTGEYVLHYEDDGETLVQNLTVRPDVVESTNLTVVSGTEPTGTVNASASFDSNGLSVKAVNAIGQSELATEGVDATTTFRLNVTVENLTSRVFVGSARNATWERISINDTHTKHVFEGTPAEEQFLDGAPSLDAWPSDGTMQATFARQQTFSFTGFQLEGAPSDHQTRLDGTLIATDAQTFGTPRYVNLSGEEPKFTIELAAPHYKANEVDGQKVVNDGYYEAQLPSQLVDDWGVSDPESELSALYQGASQTFSASSLSDGGLAVSLDLHYSAGTVAVSPSDTNDDSTTDDSTSDDSTSDDSTSDDWDDDSTDDTSNEDDQTELTDDTDAAEDDTERVVELPEDAPTDEPVSVVNVTAGTNVTIDFGMDATEESVGDAAENVTDDGNGSEAANAGSPADVESLNVSVDSNASFSVNVSTSQRAPETASDETDSLPENHDTAAYVSVEHDGLTNADIGGAAMTLSVSKERFDSRSDAANATVLRLHDGEWQHIDTTLVGETGHSYRFRAESPGLSVFAVVEPEPDVSVADATLDASAATVGDTLTVTATVTNDGGAGDATVSLSLDGSEAATETFSLGANERTTVELVFEPDAPGEVSVAVGDASAGTLEVAAQTTTATTTEAAQTSTTTDEDGESGGSVPGFGVGSALVALLAACLLRVRG
jgi:PGF-pre-PGF domain-containing protein/PGF-CTERM protein